MKQGAEAEVGEADARLAGLVFPDQHIARLEVLVQDAGAVHRSHGLGDLHEQHQARGQIQRRQPATLLGPGDQVVAAVGTFDEERCRLEIPFEDLRQIAPFAEHGAGDAGDGHFALQRREGLAIVGELEDARFAGLVVFGQPDPARFRSQRTNQPPGAASRHRIARREPGVDRAATDPAAADRTRVAIADAVLGDDQGLAVVAQHLAQAADGIAEHAFDGDPPGPHRVEDFLLGHHLAGVAQQEQQHVQRLGIQFLNLAGNAQLAGRFVEHRGAELPDRHATRCVAVVRHVAVRCRGDQGRGLSGRPEGCVQLLHRMQRRR